MTLPNILEDDEGRIKQTSVLLGTCSAGVLHDSDGFFLYTCSVLCNDTHDICTGCHVDTRGSPIPSHDLASSHKQ